MDEKEEASASLENKVGEAQNKKNKFNSKIEKNKPKELVKFEILEEIKEAYLNASKNRKTAETRLKKWEEAINKQIEEAIKQGKIKDDDDDAVSEMALKFLENKKGIMSKVLESLEKNLPEIKPETDVKKITETKTEDVVKRIKIKFPKVANFPEKEKDKLIKLGLSEQDEVLFKKNPQGIILIYKKDKNGLHLIAEENKGKLTQSVKAKEAENIEESPVKKLKEKYGDFLKENLFNINHPQDWINVYGYNEKAGEAKVFDSHFENGKKSRKITLAQLEELLKLYKKKETEPEKKPELKKMEEVERERAQKAQEIIDNTHFDSATIPEKERDEESEEKNENELEEEDQKIKEIQTVVEQARKNYALEDYKVTNILAKIRKVLGGNLHSTSGNLQETHGVYNKYKIELTRLLDYQREKLQEKNLPPEKLSEEMEKLTKYFNQDEKFNLFDAHTEARAEILEKKFGKKTGQVVQFFNKYLKKYEKLSLKKRMALSVTVMLSGVGVVIAGHRIIGGAAAGVGVTAGLEARYRGKEEKRLAKERFDIKKKLEEAENPEEKYKMFMESMQAEIDGYQKNLKTEKDKARNRKLMGATVATFIGSGAASYLTHWGMEKSGASNYLSSHLSVAKKFWENVYDKYLGHHIVETAHKGIISSSVAHHAVASSADHLATKPSSIPQQPYSAAPSAKIYEAVKTPVQPIKGSGIKQAHATVAKGLKHSLKENIAPHVNHIEIAQKGDSVWKMIGKDLQTHSGKTFSTLNPEQKTYVIDALKDNLAQHHTEFGLKNIDKIKIGQKIDFSKLFDHKHGVDLNKIINQAKQLNQDQLKNIAHNNKAILNWTHSHPSQSLDSDKVQQILSSKKNIAPNINHATKVATKPTEQIHTKAVDHLVTKPSSIPQQPYSAAPSAKIYEAVKTPNATTSGVDHLVTKPSPISPKSHLAEKILSKNKTGPVLNASAMGVAAGGVAMGAVEKIRNKSRKNNPIKFSEAEKNTQETSQKTNGKTLEKFQILTQRYKFNENDNFDSRAKKTIQAVSLNSLENWKFMKNIKFSEIEEGRLSKKLVKNIKNLEKDFVNYVGQQAKHRKTETLKRWIARVVKISTDQEKESFKKAA